MKPCSTCNASWISKSKIIVMGNMMTDHRPLHVDLGILFLRLIFGGMLMYIGYLKLSSYQQTLGMFTDPLGIGKELSLVLVIFAELFCGFFIAIGLLTRLTVIPVFILMTIVFFIVHKEDAFVMKQLPFVYWLICVVIFIFGSGRFSVDKLLFKR